MKVLDLFSGIGGFSLGFERAGFKTAAFCEIDPDCQAILKNHWSDIPIYSDIKNLSQETLENDGIFTDIITGGFPCTDLSCAGQQGGIHKTRSGLWWEMRRLISEIRPRFAIMENVPNLLSGERGDWFGEFLWSLAEIGYDAEWSCISAAAAGKPHCRERVWIIAYPTGLMFEGCGELFKRILPESFYQQRPKSQTCGDIDYIEYFLELLPKNLRVDDGVSLGLDEIKARVKALGNSLIPEIAYLIAKQLKDKC